MSCPCSAPGRAPRRDDTAGSAGDGPDPARNPVQHLRAVLAADDDVLDPDAESALEVDAGLDAEGDAGPQGLPVARDEVRFLVALEAYAVAHSVQEPRAVTACGDRAPGGRVDGLAPDPGANLVRGGLVRAEHELVDRAVLRARRMGMVGSLHPEGP